MRDTVPRPSMTGQASKSKAKLETAFGKVLHADGETTVLTCVPSSNGTCRAGCDILLCSRDHPCRVEQCLPARSPAQMNTCGELQLQNGTQIAGELVLGSRILPRERYLSLVHCGGAWLMSSRAGFFDVATMSDVPEHGASSGNLGEQVSLLRSVDPGSPQRAARISHPRLMRIPSASDQSPANPLAHNIGCACLHDNRTLLAFGGRHKPNSRFGDDGVRRSVARLMPLPAWGPQDWSAPQLVTTGDAGTGCLEMRKRFKRTGCEFDGRLSVAWHDGALLLFARANMGDRHGARHVQVARSLDAGVTWGTFQLCELDGYEQKGANNIYFFDVRSVSEPPPLLLATERRERTSGPQGRHGPAASSAATLLAMYPAVIDGEGGVYLSVGRDGSGVRWSRPQRLLPSLSFHSRTFDHPAGLMAHADGSASVFVLRSVDVTVTTVNSEKTAPWGGKGFTNGECFCAGAPAPTLCSYRVPGGEPHARPVLQGRRGRTSAAAHGGGGPAGRRV